MKKVQDFVHISDLVVFAANHGPPGLLEDVLHLFITGQLGDTLQDCHVV